jgi:hypothetical protein
MRILIACEFSGIVRDAFTARGHYAMSCDLLPTESPGPHYQGDVFDIINDNWDMMIAHPPCTYLSYAATCRWNEPGRCKKRLEALDFFRKLYEAPIEKICIENPKGCASPTIAKYSQEIQPFYFGDSAYKTTWLWLKNLPLLIHSEEDTLFDKKTSCPPLNQYMLIKMVRIFTLLMDVKAEKTERKTERNLGLQLLTLWPLNGQRI